ncbi:hypothetical protein [Spongiactinospora sp. TRM90649]|uniref:TolB family protein n=1 Tax=Spongiactinospora sp. TRM90649 TaxID=3031114 RepID=UPI0023F95F76|nr:hypothetical protein [Spongiactinospora sp. TRM90649]MDF5752891.1 hypothetical protein [Spongiactinospora sp. TRM90649]
MTTFRDHLTAVADEAPAVDLAGRALHKARRRRRVTGYASATAGAVAAMAAAVAFAGVAPSGSAGRGVITSQVTDTLPASGVGPLSYAYYDWCGEEWKPGVNTHRFAKECAQWNVVTRDGRKYRMPEALSVYTEQTADEYMNTNAPLVISSDGRRVAYYSERDRAIAVRDLDGGQVRLVPVPITRAELVAEPMLITLSPDGSRLAMWRKDRPDVIVKVETGEVTRVPDGWHVRALDDAGDLTVVVRDGEERRLGRLGGDGEVRPFPTLKDEPQEFGVPSGDGSSLSFLSGLKTGVTSSGKEPGSGRPNDTVVTIDPWTGKVLHIVRLRADGPIHPMRTGGWVGPTEVIVSASNIDRPWKGGVPTLGDRTYRVDVKTGRVTPSDDFGFPAWAGSLELPGF